MSHKEKILFEVETDYIKSLIRNNQRLDGRKLLEWRPIQVEMDYVQKAEGSALVKLGDTTVLVGVKAELGEPFPDTPNQGVILVASELLPMASPEFESGPPPPEAIELARVVDRGLRESNLIDLESLCVIPGKKVWILFVDIYVLDDDGNLIDASTLGAIAALSSTYLPKVEVLENDEINLLDEKIPLKIHDIPIAVTLNKIENKVIVDSTKKEMSATNKRITITINDENKIVAMQKQDNGTFTAEEIFELVKIAIDQAKFMREKILKLIKVENYEKKN